MKIYIFFILFFLSGVAQAQQNMQKAVIDSENNYYQENINDTVYKLNNSDSLTRFVLTETIYTFPIIFIYEFKDNFNNSVKIQSSYSRDDYIIYYRVHNNITATLNDQKVSVCGLISCNFATISSTTLAAVNYIFGDIEQQKYTFSSRNIELSGTENIEFNTTYYFNTIILPNKNITDMQLSGMYIQYNDARISVIENFIAIEKSKLHPIINFVFFIFKALLYIFSKISDIVAFVSGVTLLSSVVFVCVVKV